MPSFNYESMEIVNVVATVKASQSFELAEIQEKVKGGEFASTKAWLKMRLIPEGYYVAFYKSGKFLITGVKSVSEVEIIADKIISLLKDAEISIGQIKISIHNFVIQDHIEMKSTLEKLMYVLDQSKASYEPEQFPGLVYKDWGASFILFSSGKITITGRHC
ncbi:TATA-box-binding family protein [Methanolobus psychrophilus R15]|nr:TATA-box-binding family protein [Methanolobus psychrophilus R15]